MTLTEQHGLFYPAELTAEAIDHSRQALLAGVGTMGHVQTWGQGGWKTPHYSYASVERFGQKSSEEHGELRRALEAYLFRQSDTDAEALHTEALSELGDTAFSLTLLALNSCVELPEAMRQTVQCYREGTTHLRNGQQVPQPWQAAAAEIIARPDPTIASIDQLIAAGFEPALSTHMNRYDDEPEIAPTANELLERATWLIVYIAKIRQEADNQFSDGGGFDFKNTLQVDETVYDRYAAVIGRMIAQVYLETAYLAQHALGSSLAETASHTVTKISRRISAGRIDKTDGPRNAALK